ncbi:MAG TPA: hypothetical protein VFS25_05125 [Chitinophaga sp.]|uniref:4'-phosphopantetheinyl transferase family protein n=1 Tax=Chitinophaga sp. TaxID=1869181 RepID=UPI002DB7F440|nr:hypothetical protein [Chitinophaga sp.]HEU4552190.1 hypothetical protein [Chitinophaga sp.]
MNPLVFIAEVMPEAGKDKINALRGYFSDEIVNRLDKSPGPGHRLKRVTSRMMLVRIFNELGLETSRLKGLHYNPHGKLVTDTGKPHISISYSTNIVACVVSSSKVGIDVEDTCYQPAARSVDLLEKLTKRKIKDQLDFFSLWTQIESIAKLYDDKGLAKIFYGGLLSEKHYTRQFLFKNKYMVSIASATRLNATGQVKTLMI